MKENNIIIKNVNRNEALRYLGYKNTELDDKTKELLLRCEEKLLKAIKPEYIYKVFDLEGYNVVGCDFALEGDSIKEHLKGCSKVIFLCATLSSEVDKLIRKEQIVSMTEAVVIDAMASAVIEQVLDQVEQIIFKDFSQYQHTWRFGIGYGDFPLTLQKKFLDILDGPKRIGLCVNDSLMLTPTKSVTCVIGLGKTLEDKKRKTCEICTLKDNCQYRKAGQTCGK